MKFFKKWKIQIFALVLLFVGLAVMHKFAPFQQDPARNVAGETPNTGEQVAPVSGENQGNP